MQEVITSLDIKSQDQLLPSLIKQINSKSTYESLIENFNEILTEQEHQSEKIKQKINKIFLAKSLTELRSQETIDDQKKDTPQEKEDFDTNIMEMDQQIKKQQKDLYQLVFESTTLANLINHFTVTITKIHF